MGQLPQGLTLDQPASGLPPGLMLDNAPDRFSQHEPGRPAPDRPTDLAGSLQDATISPPETGVTAAIDRFRGRLRTLMRADRPAADVVGGMALGPVNVAHGIAVSPQHPLRGINEAVAGVGQTAALPMAIVNPGFMAEAAPYIAAQKGVSSAASSMGADPDVAEFLGNLAIPGAALSMKGTQAAARIAQRNPTVTNHILGLAGGGSALYDLIHGRPLDAAKSALITTAIKAGIGIAAESDIPNPASKLMEFLRRGPDREMPAPEQKALPPASIELGPSSATPQTIEGVLPAASRITPSGRTQYLTRPLRPGESPAVAKDTNTLSQDYFIQKMRTGLETPTVSGETEQLANLQRMMEYAKTPVDKGAPQFAYRSRNAGETGVMPASGKQQASINPDQVRSYMEGRGAAENHPQELVKIDLSKLDPSEYTIDPKSGYVRFKTAVPESFIEKMGSKAMGDVVPRVPTSDADMMNLLMESVRRAQARK